MTKHRRYPPVHAAPGVELIVPLIKADLGPAPAGGGAADVDSAEIAIIEPLAGDLLVSYAFDLPNMFQFVAPRDLARLGVRREDLRALAIGNMAQRLPPLQCHGPSPHFMIVCGGNFEASLLLLDSLWRQLAQQVDGELVVAVPARDVLMFTGSRSREGLKAMADAVARIHAQPDLQHGLSRRMYAQKDGSWRAVRVRGAG